LILLLLILLLLTLQLLSNQSTKRKSPSHAKDFFYALK
jgi:hypothetical protein